MAWRNTVLAAALVVALAIVSQPAQSTPLDVKVSAVASAAIVAPSGDPPVGQDGSGEKGGRDLDAPLTDEDLRTIMKEILRKGNASFDIVKAFFCDGMQGMATQCNDTLPLRTLLSTRQDLLREHRPILRKRRFALGWDGFDFWQENRLQNNNPGFGYGQNQFGPKQVEPWVQPRTYNNPSFGYNQPKQTIGYNQPVQNTGYKQQPRYDPGPETRSYAPEPKYEPQPKYEPEPKYKPQPKYEPQYKKDEDRTVSAVCPSQTNQSQIFNFGTDFTNYPALNNAKKTCPSRTVEVFSFASRMSNARCWIVRNLNVPIFNTICTARRCQYCHDGPKNPHQGYGGHGYDNDGYDDEGYDNDWRKKRTVTAKVCYNDYRVIPVIVYCPDLMGPGNTPAAIAQARFNVERIIVSTSCSCYKVWCEADRY